MERPIRYIKLSEAEHDAKQHIEFFVASHNKADLDKIMGEYRNVTPDDFDNAVPNRTDEFDDSRRISHSDVFYFCVFAKNVPERFKINGSIHPGPNVMNAEDREILVSHFIANKGPIIDKVEESIINSKRKFHF